MGTYRLLSSERHWLLYASTLTSLRNEGAANSWTLILVEVIVSVAATEAAHTISRVGRGPRRVAGSIIIITTAASRTTTAEGGDVWCSQGFVAVHGRTMCDVQERREGRRQAAMLACVRGSAGENCSRP